MSVVTRRLRACRLPNRDSLFVYARTCGLYLELSQTSQIVSCVRLQMSVWFESYWVENPCMGLCVGEDFLTILTTAIESKWVRVLLVNGVGRQMSDTRPLEVGETIALTDTVHSKSVVGLDLPANAKFANEDQRFDTFEVEILEEVRRTEAPPGNISSQLFRVRGEDGTETTVSYGGRSFIGDHTLSQSNSQGSQQSWTWERL